MMKKLTLLAALTLAAATTLTSCEKFLEVKPIDAKTEEGALNTLVNVQQLLAASYGNVMNGAFFGGRVQRLSELFSDNVDPSLLTGQNLTINNRAFSAFAGTPGDDVWTNGYFAIDRANRVIFAVDNNTFPADQGTKNTLKGEALFIRALAHFEMVRLFAKPYTADNGNAPGIPIRIVPGTPEIAQTRMARASVGAVYSQVINDLQAAEGLLPGTNPDRATSWAAKAMLARVFFNQNNFQSAYDKANEVINSGQFSLANSPVTAPFRNGGAGKTRGGVIFQQVSSFAADLNADLRGNFYNLNPNNTPISIPLGSGSLYEDIRAVGGWRLDSLVTDTSRAQAFDRPASRKFQGLDPNGSQAANYAIIRVAEMYLIRAEAGVELNKPEAEVLADINVLRTVANAPQATSPGDRNALLELVRRERRVELYFENDRFHELRRQRKSSRSSTGETFNFDSCRLLPIPQAEVNGNPDIEQNC